MEVAFWREGETSLPVMACAPQMVSLRAMT
jgi:hypothetical protein